MTNVPTETNAADCLSAERDRLYAERFRAWGQLMDERDKRYDARFTAQEMACQAADHVQHAAMQTALMAQKLSVDVALAAADRAVAKAEIAAEKRFESVNEFRASLSDQQRTLMPRAESELLMRNISERLDTLMREIAGLREFRSEDDGKEFASRSFAAQKTWALGVAISILFGISSIVFSIISLLRK